MIAKNLNLNDQTWLCWPELSLSERWLFWLKAVTRDHLLLHLNSSLNVKFICKHVIKQKYPRKLCSKISYFMYIIVGSTKTGVKD